MRNEQIQANEIQVNEMSTPSMQLKLTVLIPAEKKVCKESIEFNTNIIASYKEDIENLKAIKGFEKFVEYKRQAIIKMQMNISNLEKELIDLNVESDCLSIQLKKRMIKVIIPTQTNKIYQQINALKGILPTDDEKSREIHVQAIIDLEKALITDFICIEWYKLSDDAEGKDCFTEEIIDNKDTDKIIEVLKNRCYINHVYYQLAVKGLQECFDDCEQLIVPQETASYYSDIMDLIEDLI